MRSITTSTQEIIQEENGIILSRVLPGKFLELKDGMENLEAIHFLTRGQKANVLLDISGAQGVSKECRAFFSGEQFAKSQQAMAILAQSPLSKLIGSFFLGFNRPRLPISLFSNRSQAMHWLTNAINER